MSRVTQISNAANDSPAIAIDFSPIKILATMLAPDNPKIIEAEIIAKIAADNPDLPENKEWSETFQLCNAIVIDNYLNGNQAFEAMKSSAPGAIAGDILLYLMQMDHAGIADPSLKKAMWIAADYTKGAVHQGSKKVGYSVAAVKGYWRKYKSVAHLWAAFRMMQFQQNDPRDGLRLSATIFENLGYFFAIVKVFQDFADNFEPTRLRTPEPLLPPTAWRVAGPIRPATVTPPPLEDWQLKALSEYKNPNMH